MKTKRIKPGRKWRVLAQDGNEQRAEMANCSTFDELVVDQWIHIERMEPSVWWMRVGEYVLWVRVAADGTAKSVSVQKWEET